VLGQTHSRASISQYQAAIPFLFLHTDDFWRDYRAYKAKGVTFVREPTVESYGSVAVFEDLYGNLWDVLQLSATASPSGGYVNRDLRSRG